jgi:hypothetical protein
LLGKSFNRLARKHLQPPCYAFVDHPASKHWHVHSIWCAHPGIARKFNELVEGGFFDQLVESEIGSPIRHCLITSMMSIPPVTSNVANGDGC